MAQTSRRSFASFDKRSVLLFAALSLGGVAALHAQQTPATGTAPGTSQTSPKAVMGPAAAPSNAQPGTGAMGTPSAASKAAFAKADANHDGQLSAKEAATLPAIGNRFQELDTDKNGMLSSEEFHEGAKL